MIAVAEQLVAERGLAALSLRQVQELSGQANKSAAQYHFGSRSGLVEAVIDARMSTADASRRALLSALAENTDGPTPRRLVEALVLPFVEASIGTPGSRYARFMAQVLLDPGLAAPVWSHYRAGSLREAGALLVEACPLPSTTARARVDQVMSLVTVTLAFAEARGRDPALVGEELVDASLALLELDPGR